MFNQKNMLWKTALIITIGVFGLLSFVNLTQGQSESPEAAAQLPTLDVEAVLAQLTNATVPEGFSLSDAFVDRCGGIVTYDDGTEGFVSLSVSPSEFASIEELQALYEAPLDSTDQASSEDEFEINFDDLSSSDCADGFFEDDFEDFGDSSDEGFDDFEDIDIEFANPADAALFNAFDDIEFQIVDINGQQVLLGTLDIEIRVNENITRMMFTEAAFIKDGLLYEISASLGADDVTALVQSL